MSLFKFRFLLLPRPYLLCLPPIIYLGGLLVRLTPFLSTRPGRSLRFLLSAWVLICFHVRLLFRFWFRLWYRLCLCRPFLCALQVCAVLFPPPPRNPLSWPPSGPLTEVQNCSHRNILRDRILPPCDRLPYPFEPRFTQCLQQRRVSPAPISLLLPRLLPGDPTRDPVLKNFQGLLHPWGEDLRLRPKQQHQLGHRILKIHRHLRIWPLPAQNTR